MDFINKSSRKMCRKQFLVVFEANQTAIIQCKQVAHEIKKLGLIFMTLI